MLIHNLNYPYYNYKECRSSEDKVCIYDNAIKRLCEEEKLDYEVFYTTSKNLTVEIVKDLEKENNIIYSVGGYDTLPEVVNGMIGTNNKLGIIPSVSGNELYRADRLLRVILQAVVFNFFAYWLSNSRSWLDIYY